MSRDTCNQNDPENCPGDCSECPRDPDARRDREDGKEKILKIIVDFLVFLQ